jgi:hypothetical protein
VMDTRYRVSTAAVYSLKYHLVGCAPNTGSRFLLVLWRKGFGN